MGLSTRRGPVNFDFARFTSNRIDLSEATLFRSTDIGTIDTVAMNYLSEYLSEFEYIIGYELSKETRHLFERLDKIYIDVWLSPIRFYKDVMFEFGTNSKYIHASLERYKFDNSLLIEQFSTLKKYCDDFIRQPKLTDDSCLSAIPRQDVAERV